MGMAPMIQDFFGKKLGKFVQRAVANFSPIDLARREQLNKFKTAARTLGGIGLEGTGRGAHSTLPYHRRVGHAMAHREAMGGSKYGLRDYFAGRNIEDVTDAAGNYMTKRRFWGAGENGAIRSRMTTLPEQIRQRRQAFRVGLPAALAGGTVLNWAIGDNPVSRVVDTGSSLGVAAGATLGATRLAGRYLGKSMGPYGGLVAAAGIGINAMTRGDQWGPF